MDATTVAISGGGPAGVMLGLLLARQGVEVVVLEKHADFLRDFRGDTVHPSTQVVLQQLGLLDELQGVVRGRMGAIDMRTTAGPLLHVDLARVNRRHPFHEILLAPQWDLLDLLVRHARQLPCFRLEMEAETLGPLHGHTGAVSGLRYRQHGEEHELRAVLTVDAEGRGSVLRPAVGAPVIDLGSAIDVLWFRIPRLAGDPAELRGVVGTDGVAVAINRHDYWQMALVVRKGTGDAVRAAGLDAFRDRVAGIAPWTADRLDGIRDWDDVKPLSVTLDRLARWSAPGILAIGDAAHTMSPIGGVGINLAIADAVATANLLGPVLSDAQQDPDRFERVLNPALLERVQRRRSLATAATQRVQVLAQGRIFDGGTALRTPPAPMRAALRATAGRIVPRVFVYGLRPERISTPAAA